MAIERIRHILETSNGNIMLNEELAQRLNLSLPRLKRYFHVMETKGLLARDIAKSDPHYRITLLGRRFLSWYHRIQCLLLKQEPSSCCLQP